MSMPLPVRGVMVRVFFWDSNRQAPSTLKGRDKI
jgi:hypothetical protein